MATLTDHGPVWPSQDKRRPSPRAFEHDQRTQNQAGRATPLPDAVLSRSAIDEIAGAYLEEARGNVEAALRRAIHDALAQTLHAERLVSHGFVRGEFALRGNRPKSKG